MPVIMLTARTAEMDRVAGLENGADDYVVKPFGIMELQARVKMCIRDSRPQGQAHRGLYHRPVRLSSARGAYGRTRRCAPTPLPGGAAYRT